MRILVTLMIPNETRDVALSCDVTVTVADVARTLLRTGLFRDERAEKAAHTWRAPVTLRGYRAPGADPVVFDPLAAISGSGLQSGWSIEPVLDDDPQRSGRRLVDVAGVVEVLSGSHAGVRYHLVSGVNVIGRDRACRVYLGDQSVSRRHVALNVDAHGIGLRDLGSANGTIVNGARVETARLSAPCEIRLGEVTMRVQRGVAARPAPRFDYRHRHMRSPRVIEVFQASERELPTPPKAPEPTRLPLIAALAPVLMGGTMFLVTQSPMSLMMMAFSPVLMLGSWLDGRFGGRRAHRRDQERFLAQMSATSDELTRLQHQEIAVRVAEAPSLAEVTQAVRKRESLLWARRPEHRPFLEMRFGLGRLPSRTRVSLPPRGDTPDEVLRAFLDLGEKLEEVAPVPVLENLHRCGSVGVVGDPFWAAAMARAMVWQMIGLHSPAEVSLACFGDQRSAEEWGWLKWVPHAAPGTHPLPLWPLTNSEQASRRLLIALEELLEARQRVGGRLPTVRSDVAPDAGQQAETSKHADADPVHQTHGRLPVVVVLVLNGAGVDASRLIWLMEVGPDFGIYVMWVGQQVASVPAACRTYVEASPSGARVSYVREARTVALLEAELMSAAEATSLARSLAPVEDTAARALDATDLPESVHLRDLHQADLLGGGAPILQAWEQSGSLTAQWQAGVDRDPVSLAAIVGQGPDGPAMIDLRADGPHAIVGGTTGSGKSEFLQTWIMSLAAQISPDRLTFLLVDYKGGAAFAECARLPHTVGLVTDLGPHDVRRALVSLRAELRHREELLARHGAKDLITMERRSDAAAPPVLIIVVDEFAALTADVPEFVDGVLDVAQRGRSLGLHLILATQRPAGVITENMRANTNVRVALRMADAADSRDVISAPDAAYFDPATPGRGAITVGSGQPRLFQAAYVGGRPFAAEPVVNIDVRSVPFGMGEAWNIPPEAAPARGRRASRSRDIEQLGRAISAAATAASVRVPRRPWLDPLPSQLTLRSVQMRLSSEEEAPVLGLRDEPAQQQQRPVRVSFEECGSLAVIGASGSGKTTALLTLAASLSGEARSHAIQIYAIDAAGGSLAALHTLPTVGAVAALHDAELVRRILRHLVDVIAERGPRFAAARAADLTVYRKSSGATGEPRIVLLVDGFAVFRQTFESLTGAETPWQLLTRIITTGRAVGVHVAMTADRPSAIPSSMLSAVQRQFVLRLANAYDYAQLGVPANALEQASPGRAVIIGTRDEMQFAVPGDGADFAEHAHAFEMISAELEGIDPAPAIRNAPERIALNALPVVVGERPVYGVDVRSAAPVGLPVRGLGVISGPAGSGQSTAALTCVRALQRWGATRGVAVDAVLLTCGASALRAADCWTRVVEGPEAVAVLADQITAQPATVPRPGTHRVIVVERPADTEGTPALSALVALARYARRMDALVLFEFEQGTASGMWELFTALKQPTWGVTLQPDESEPQTPFRETLGRVRRTDFPTGRGFAVERGVVTPVHVALSEACPETDDSA